MTPGMPGAERPRNEQMNGREHDTCASDDVHGPPCGEPLACRGGMRTLASVATHTPLTRWSSRDQSRGGGRNGCLLRRGPCPSPHPHAPCPADAPPRPHRWQPPSHWPSRPAAAETRHRPRPRRRRPSRPRRPLTPPRLRLRLRPAHLPPPPTAARRHRAGAGAGADPRAQRRAVRTSPPPPKAPPRTCRSR